MAMLRTSLAKASSSLRLGAATNSKFVLSRNLYATAIRKEHHFDVTPEQFEATVLKAPHGDRLVLVDFYADWCGPCKALSPELEAITSDPSQTGGKEVDLVTVNTDVEINLAQQFQVRSLPMVVGFSNGKPLGHFVGAIPPAKLKQVVNDWVKA